MPEPEGHGREAIAPEPRGRMVAEPARDVTPKLRVIRHRGEEDAPRFVIVGAREDESAEAWERRVNGEPEGELQ